MIYYIFSYNRILDAVGSAADGIPIANASEPVIIAQNSFAVSIKQVVPEEFNRNGQNFSINIPRFSNQNITSDDLSFGDAFNSPPTASIQLPNDLLSGLPGNMSNARITHAVFVTDSLFLRRNFNYLNVSSIIISAGVVGMASIRGLRSPVNLSFQRNPVRITTLIMVIIFLILEY